VIGDVNGDHKADITAFEHGQGGGFGVYVSLSNSTFSGGANFAARGLWADGFCFSTEECAVGDVNGDGKADIIVFQHGYPGSPKTGVYVGLSDVWLLPSKPQLRFATPFQKWHDNFCVWHRDDKSEYADQCMVGTSMATTLLI
jgi:FG-GAP-like repeat